MKRERAYEIDKDFVSMLNREIRREVVLSSTSWQSGGERRFRVKDNDMAPSVLPDDRITVEPAGINQIKVGNLVLVRQGEKVTLRRAIRFIVKETEVRLVVKADAKNEEEIVRDIDILGKVIALEREGKKIKVPDTSNLLKALSGFRFGSAKDFFKDVVSRIIPFTSDRKRT